MIFHLFFAVTHAERIVNSHRGYLDNYVECLSEIYHKDVIGDEKFGKHFDLLVQVIQGMRQYYRVYLDQDIKNYRNRLKSFLLRRQQEKDRL